jgi:hypothetical protein
LKDRAQAIGRPLTAAEGFEMLAPPSPPPSPWRGPGTIAIDLSQAGKVRPDVRAFRDGARAGAEEMAKQVRERIEVMRGMETDDVFAALAALLRDLGGSR